MSKMRRPDGRFDKKELSNAQRLYRIRCSRERRRLREEPWNWVSGERFRAAVRGWIDKQRALDGDNSVYNTFGHSADRRPMAPIEMLAHLVGRPPRYVYRNLTEKVTFKYRRGQLQMNTGADGVVSIYTVDEFLTAMGRTDLLLAPPEDGGFADVYLHPGLPQAPEDALLAA